MTKKLSEMSLEELWQSFPVILTSPNKCWSDWFIEEKANLEKRLPCEAKITHIGSTAVKTIWAKPIIDIIVEIPQVMDINRIGELIISSGYICMKQSKNRISFNKGYTEKGFEEKVFHLHLRYEGDNDEIYFRDYLINHPDAAKEYEKIKLGLWRTFEHDRDRYTMAKTEFVRKYTDMAKMEGHVEYHK